MLLKESLFNLPIKLRIQNVIGVRHFSSKSIDHIIESAEEKPIYVEEEETNLELEKKRNKSRLNPEHRNILYGQKPYNEPLTWYHNTVKYKKRILGRYGLQALGIPAGMAWPTLEEVNSMKEYENIAFPLTIQERLNKIKEKKRKDEELLTARQQHLEAKMANMDKMIMDIQEKVAKKQAEMLEAQMKKERKIEEIRSKLLAEGHVSAEKIQKALTQMEKEEKKKKKEAKKARQLEKQKEWVEKLLQENTEVNQKSDAEENMK